MRTIKKIHKAQYSPIADLVTYSALPTRSLDQIDPFLFLNHHGPQVYAPKNNGLPFGPHPHRGMETVTFIIDGDIMHKDSGGHESVINAGGVQWMTAGRGLIHAEVSSKEFKEKGGKLEILQLWVNLPARDKMTNPFYSGLQKEDIPTLSFDEGRITVDLISGSWEEHKAPFQSVSKVNLSLIHFKKDGTIEVQIPESENVFFYIIRGKLTVNGQEIAAFNLVEFDHDHSQLKINALEDSILLFGHAVPLDEPVVAQGPFVMNTEEQIHEAYDDYRSGKFGSWR